MTRAADLAKLIAGGGTITVADNSTNITLKSTDDDANGGPVFDLTRDSASPADNDAMGSIRFRSDDDGGNETQFVDVTGYAPDVSDGSEDGQLQIRTIVGGTLRNRLDLASGETVFNEDSVDVDFRVESNGNANMLVIDGGNNIASIGRAVNSSSTLAIQNKDDTNNNAIDVFNDNGNRTFSIQSNTSGDAQFKAFKNGGTQGFTLLEDGSVTNPLQPAFLVFPSGDQDNIASGDTVAFATERFDQGGDFASNTFTAPVTGRYQMSYCLRIDNVESDAIYTRTRLITSNRTIQPTIIDLRNLSGDPAYWHFQVSILTDMDANDTAYVQFNQSQGTTQADIQVTSFFSGYLAC